MAKVTAYLVALHYYILPYLLLGSIGTQKSNGLTLKLYHPDSQGSPFFQANMTYAQRIEALLKQSKSREYLLFRRLQENSTAPLTIRGHTDIHERHLLVEVSVGTFAHRGPISYFLAFDTGSDLVWIQCEPCRSIRNHCFPQEAPLFPMSQSSSFQPIPYNHRYCMQSQHSSQVCPYKISYLDRSYTRGIFANETFTFGSSTSHEESVQVVFGCGYDQRNFDFLQPNKVAGILGMGLPRPYPSFVQQVESQSHGRFSICLPTLGPDGHVPISYLQFGTDIPLRDNLHSTRLMTFQDQQGYYLNLLDISLDGHRLNIPSFYFARHTGYSLGCAFDTGSSLSFINEYAFMRLVEALRAYFSQRHGYLYVGRIHNMHACFQKPLRSGFRDLPTITFNFEGANYLVRQEHMYFIDSNHTHSYFCLGILKASHGFNIIGSMQMTNKRIIFDTTNMELLFGPENCGRINE